MSALPKYKNPPVVETVISVQFPELAGFKVAHFGRYHERIETEFRKVVDQPRLPEHAELFPRRPSFPVPNLRLAKGGTPEREWFVSQSDSELIQLQPDRYVFNWKVSEGSAYPSFEVNFKKFLQQFDGFCGFCSDCGLDEPRPNLCEVTYVNHIMPNDGETSVELFGEVFSGLKWDCAEAFLPGAESVSFNRVFVIGENLGRLYAGASIAIDAKQKREFVLLTMTGRTNHPAGDRETLVGSLELAHEWVVRGFASLTDLTIQKTRWQRIQ